MDVLCLDLEGVLIPEIWVGVAEKTGIEALRKTVLALESRLASLEQGAAVRQSSPQEVAQH